MFLTQNLGDAGQGGDGRCLCALPVSGGVGCLWGGEIRIQLYRCVALWLCGLWGLGRKVGVGFGG